MATASEISLTGIIFFAPFCKAVTKVLVARRMSKTTQAVSRKSRWASAGNSVGDRRVSIFILGAGDSIIFSGQNSTSAFAARAGTIYESACLIREVLQNRRPFNWFGEMAEWLKAL